MRKCLLMDKTDYILRSLTKISNKRWEHYVVTRIYHLLDDPDIEFVCQQCIRKDDGKIYLADLFFPQLSLYLEIDEGHHNSEQSKINDAKRRMDITEATGFLEKRIPASEITLETLNHHIDKFVELIRTRKNEMIKDDTFNKWDYENKYTAHPHFHAGKISVGPDAVFRYHKDALNCFGYNKGHHQSGGWSIPPHISEAIGLSGKCMVWFPKLYGNSDWGNELTDDGRKIIERNIKDNEGYTEKWDKRIVMAHSRDELNRTLYRFLGVFEAIPGCHSGNILEFRRVSTSVNVYPPATLFPHD